ncbi:DUF6977 family protein [Devosia sp.]|uniref:DarT1-associated NADAR antitoxin family protein n=1 Tax=Devosia sp. TaxID=1871048 RepID=UPI003263DB85
MAERPVFLPQREGLLLVQTARVEFPWHPGMAPVQKKKNVAELHSAAHALGLYPLLETSSKSDFEAGRRLSAFHLRYVHDNIETTVEAIFQGSKVFEFGGPFTDLYHRTPREAKLDPRLQNSGHLIAFKLGSSSFPLSPPTAFYDWLYLRALFPHRDWLRRLGQFQGFTDIEFNPAKSINCQARACALFVALEWRNRLDWAHSSFDNFLSIQSAAYI